jgi:hypothetical protein
MKGTNAMTFDPTKYGLTASLSADTLIQAREQYEKVVESLKSEDSESVKDVTISEQATEDSQINMKVIRELIFRVLQDSPEVAIPLYEAIKSLNSDVKEMRDWYVADYRKRNKPDVPSNFAEAKADAEGLKAFIESLYKAMVPMFGTVIELPEDFDEKFPVKQLDKSGEIKPDLSRLPNGPRENAVGRAGDYARLVFRWQDEDLPFGISTQEVALRYVSTPMNRISSSDIFDALPHATKEDGSRGHLAMTPNEWVTLEFPNGDLDVKLHKEVK